MMTQYMRNPLVNLELTSHNGSMPKADRRISRTRRLLTDALIQLTLERGFENISLRDLTERADIGYATFFRHYPDKESLLNAILEESIATLIGIATPLVTQPKQMIAAMFTALLEHPERYQMLLKTRHINQLLSRAMLFGSSLFIAQNAAQIPSNIPAELAARHVIGATINLIEWWLEQTPRASPEQMGEIINSLIMQPLHQSAANASGV